MKELQKIFARFYIGDLSAKEEMKLIESEEIDSLLKDQWENADSIKTEDNKPDFNRLYQRIQNNKGKQKTPSFAFVRIAASIIVVLGVSLVLYLTMRNSAIQTITKTTAKAERTEIVLPDGSTVWLNAESKLMFPEKFRETRTIRLEGEAFFDVVSKEIPFVVSSGNLAIHVLGTRFNVSNYSYSNFMETVLLEGSIQIQDTGSVYRETMEPNQIHRFDKQKKSYTLQKINAAEYTSWKDGKLVFNNTPLSKIAKELKKWYGYEFETANQKAADYRFTFTIENDKLEDVLNTITSVSPIEYSQNSNGYTFIFKD